MSAHPLFQRLFSDMGRMGLLPDTDQRVPASDPTPTPAVDRARLRDASPTSPLLSTHEGAEL
ncbi:hypothetical protein [Lysobacter fragariae]